VNPGESGHWIKWNQRLQMNLFCQWRVNQARVCRFKKTCTIVVEIHILMSFNCNINPIDVSAHKNSLNI
jgi:hypothetical protein